MPYVRHVKEKRLRYNDPGRWRGFNSRKANGARFAVDLGFASECQFMADGSRAICNRPTAGRSSYCAEHHALCHAGLQEHLNRVEGGKKAQKKWRAGNSLVPGAPGAN